MAFYAVDTAVHKPFAQIRSNLAGPHLAAQIKDNLGGRIPKAPNVTTARRSEAVPDRGHAAGTHFINHSCRGHRERFCQFLHVPQPVNLRRSPALEVAYFGVCQLKGIKILAQLCFVRLCRGQVAAEAAQRTIGEHVPSTNGYNQC